MARLTCSGWRVVLLLGLFTSCSSVEKRDLPEDYRIIPGVRVGRITPRTSEDDLRRMYGNHNVLPTQILDEDGGAPGTIVFPKDAERRVTIFWKDENRTQPGTFVINGDAKTWAMENGIRLGTTLKDLERVNGQVFRLLGFGLEYGGTVTSWEGGRLEGPYSRNGRVLIRLAPPESYSFMTNAEGEPRFGNESYPSNDREMMKANPTIYEMVIEFGVMPR